MTNTRNEFERERVYSIVKFDGKFLLTTQYDGNETKLGLALYENRKSDRSVEGIIQTAHDFGIDYIALDFFVESLGTDAIINDVALPGKEPKSSLFEYDVRRNGKIYFCSLKFRRQIEISEVLKELARKQLEF